MRKTKTIKDFVFQLEEDYNSYSELVALNWAKLKEATKASEIEYIEENKEWNSGQLFRIKEYLEQLAPVAGVSLRYECKEHTFGFDDWQRVIEYKTVEVVE